MKVIWKGPMREENVFRYGDIPEDAQKLFPERGGWAMSLLILPIFLLAYMGIRIRLSYAAGMIFSKGELLAGVLLSVLFLSVHELIHAVCCPRGSVCFLYVTPVGLCIIPANPLGKYRYIFMAVMPTVVLGIVPFLVWLFFPDINVAAGSVAFGHTAAIGTVAKAPLSITLNSGPLLNGAAATAEQIRTALQNAAPRMPDILIDLLSSFLQL